MKDYAVINELSDGTLVQSAGEYAVVKKHYACIGFKNDALRRGFTDEEIADAVRVLDFYEEKSEKDE